MGRRAILLILLLVIVVGGVFYFNSKAEPVPVETIEQPVELPSEGLEEQDG